MYGVLGRADNGAKNGVRKKEVRQWCNPDLVGR